MLLTKETGLTLQDIRGEKTISTHSEPRMDLISRIKRNLPWVNDPEDRTIEVTERTAGMMEKEVYRWLIYIDEHKSLQKKAQEEEQNTLERQMKSQMGFNQE